MTYLVGRIAVPIPRSLPLWTGFAVLLAWLGVAVLTRRPDLEVVRVAFIGNSMMYYNDLPRLMEMLSAGKMRQNSCLHGAASFTALLVWGNGMYKKWSTGNARFRLNADDDFSLYDDDDDNENNNNDDENRKNSNDNTKLYDFGACTVRQLLLGYDAQLDTRVQEFNADNYQQDDAVNVDADDFFSFYDGDNPCLESYVYYQYLNHKYASQGTPVWDYVVMNDNTRGPARKESRAESMDTLQQYYVPWLQTIQATPILVATYAYDTPYRDMTGLTDVPTYTSYTYNGYVEYSKLLAENLPATQQPRIAKVSWAFLLVYEENYQMWSNLFHVDRVHASPLGTYLQALVVYHTIYDRLPPRDIALRPDSSAMWDYARRFAPPNHRRGRFPTPDEEHYLYNVAQRICVNGLKPASLRLYDTSQTVDYTPNDGLYHEDDIF